MTVHGTTLLVLGADATIGRDELLRLIYGDQVTIEVAAFATLTALAIGVPMGAAAGYMGGRVDTAIVWQLVQQPLGQRRLTGVYMRQDPQVEQSSNHAPYPPKWRKPFRWTCALGASDPPWRSW